LVKPNILGEPMMSTALDKIRILWIDDCESQDAGYMYPEKELPTEELQRYFTIVRHPDIPGPSTIRTPQDFKTCFSAFWWGDANTDLFPPEIIGMDYNLQKWTDTKARLTEQKSRPRAYLAPGGTAQVFTNEYADTSSGKTEFSAGFEGLVLGIFTSSLLHHHPIGIVPMTSYGDLLENVPEVRALHLISKEILHIDYSEFGVSGEDRSWERVLKKGVKALRVRIEGLYETGNIVLSPSDLMNLAEVVNHPVLTIRTPYAVRRLPIEGLFIDLPVNERQLAIQKWAKDLMCTVMMDCQELKKARELADEVWDAYNNNELIEARKNLSLLASRSDAGLEIDEAEYARLREAFFVENNKAKTGCVDIASFGDYSDRVRRWASLFITCNMLKRLIKIRKKVDSLQINDVMDFYPTGPVLTANDIFLALFPVPGSPLILPWHSGEKIDNSTGWVKSMLRWKANSMVGNSRGDLALNVNDLLAGDAWEKEGPYGLTASERLVLRGFALDDQELTEADWRSSPRARQVLWGDK